MDFKYLFTSFDGRINRAKYWIGAIVLSVIALILAVIIGVIFGPSLFGRLLLLLITLGLLYVSYALAAKRFQDRDKPGITALYGIIPVAIASALQDLGLTGTPDQPNALGWICSVVSFGVGIWFLVELGILKGTTGSNRYGPDPLAAQ